MKIELNQPIVKDDKTYPYAFINIAISTQHESASGYSVSFRAVPCLDNEDGSVEKLDAFLVSTSSLNAIADNVIDTDLKQLATNIVTELQEYLNKKGI
jgi:hypothetical protein